MNYVQVTQSMYLEYTNQQKNALSAIDSFLNSEKSIFILKGYAGTGKTTLIKPILNMAYRLGKGCQLMAQTAVFQQEFFTEYLGFKDYIRGAKVSEKRFYSMVGYSKIDLGIVKYHFELGTGNDCFEWSEY